MGRQDRIDELKSVIKRNIEKAEKSVDAGTATYVMEYANFQMNALLEEKLDDISERMKLIEAALDLIANRKNDG